jgi:hypothetical protein
MVCSDDLLDAFAKDAPAPLVETRARSGAALQSGIVASVLLRAGPLNRDATRSSSQPRVQCLCTEFGSSIPGFSADSLILSNMTENNVDRETCIWTYWVRPDAEDDFVRLLAQHWPTLNRLGFVTDDPPIVFRSAEDPPVYVEIMTWEVEGMRPAHDHPDVIPIWERFKPLVEDRAEQRNVVGMSFPFFRRATLSR